MPPARVFWHGEFAGEGSMARVNRHLARAVVARGEVAIVPCGEPSPAVERMLGLEAQRVEMLPSDDAPVVTFRHRWPGHIMNPAAGYYVHMQPWEFGVAPVRWVERLRERADAVWCYSSYVRDVYVASGIDPVRVAVVPLGVDPRVYHPAVEPLPTDRPDAQIFLFVGGTLSRKNLRGAIEAFGQAFGPHDDVVLLIKDNPSVTAYDQRASEWIREIAASSHAPPIRYIEAEYSDDQMARLYRTATALLLPSRGEGFGLPALEAMACGTPVVATRGLASDDFVDDAVGYRIRASRLGLGRDVAGFELVTDGWWLNPDIEELATTLQRIHERPDEARAKGTAAAQRAAGAWTWDHAARHFAQRVAQLADYAPREPAAFADALSAYALRVTRNESDGMLNEIFSRLRVTDPCVVDVRGATDDAESAATMFERRFGWTAAALERAPVGFDLLAVGGVTDAGPWEAVRAYRPRVCVAPPGAHAPEGYTRLADGSDAIFVRDDLVVHTKLAAT